MKRILLIGTLVAALSGCQSPADQGGIGTSPDPANRLVDVPELCDRVTGALCARHTECGGDYESCYREFIADCMLGEDPMEERHVADRENVFHNFPCNY